MAPWQRRARLFIAVSAAIFAIVVAFMLGRRAPAASPAGAVRLDEKAVMESRGGEYVRRTGSREDLRIQFEKQLTYADGSSALANVTITSTDRADGRVFTVTGKEGK